LNERVDRHSGRGRDAGTPKRPQVPQVEPYDDLDSIFEKEDVHHRWLLTTCVTGIAGSLVIGSAVLGIFGENAAPRDAYAAVNTASITGTDSLSGEISKPHVSGQMIIPERGLSGDNNYPEITADDLPYGDGKTIVLDAQIASAEQEAANITTISKTPPPEPVDETFKLAKGQTLIEALADRGVTKEAAQALVAAIEPVFPTAMIREGTEFEVTLDRQQDFYGRDATYPVELSFQSGPKETIKVQSDEDGQFAAVIDGAKEGAKSQYAQYHFLTKSKVGASLYSAAKDNKVPDYIVSELTRVFAYDVDFQRQVKPDDTFEVFYGNPLTGSSSKRKVMHYARLTLAGKAKTYFRYTTADGQTDYYDERGNSATKSLLKTPVSGAKLTSGFGMRRHPILGYNKLHTGLDFGLPYGTPLRAAGDGIVSNAGRAGAYGIIVQINHNKQTATMFAHMSKLAPGIRAGTKVRQGQVVGYVGSTGRSTGPHAHYEVRVSGRPVNPALLKVSGGKQLAGKEMLKFQQMKERVVAMMQRAPSATQVAQAGP